MIDCKVEFFLQRDLDISTPQKKDYFLCAETPGAAKAWVTTLQYVLDLSLFFYFIAYQSLRDATTLYPLFGPWEYFQCDTASSQGAQGGC